MREIADANAPGGGGKRPVLIVLHQEQSNPGHIGQWFRRNGHALDIRRPRFGDPLPPTLAGHCGAVIFGGPMSANDADDYIKIETDWIGVALKEKAPLFGVCLGAQMMARLLGAKVACHPQGQVEIGYYPLAAAEPARAMGDWPAHVYEWHREGFELPAGARLLARSQGEFPNQAFAVGPAAVGVQFHPEITYAQVNRWSGHNLDKLSAPGAQPQAQHLTGHIDYAPGVRRWLDGFLTRWVRRELVLPAA